LVSPVPLLNKLPRKAAALEPSAGESRAQPLPDRLARRDALFRETPLETLQRVVLGTAWSLRPKRIDRLLPLARLCLRHLLEPNDRLPDLAKMPDAGELVGIADDLTVATLAEAYARGIFPHAHFGPTKWLSPPERCVLFFDDFHIAKRLRRLMRRGAHTVTFDRDFENVIKVCAGKREGRWRLTWITPRIMHAFCGAVRRRACPFLRGVEPRPRARRRRLWRCHRPGVLHRVPVLAQGQYVEARLRGAQLASGQMGLSAERRQVGDADHSRHELSHDPRAAFVRLLGKAVGQGGKRGRWTVEAGLEVVADWRPASSGNRLGGVSRVFA
jgi:leucyl/phenylalanyl-tRNA---protein transferase